MKKGIMYHCFGEEYIEEARRSAESVKEHHPDLDICIVTNLDLDDSELFDKVIKDNIDDFSWPDKIRHLKQSPYDKTLFLDTDIYVVDNINEIFELLNKFDVALTNNTEDYFYEDNELPESFVVPNGGLIAYRNNKAMQEFFQNWKNFYLEEHPTDQESLRKALYLSDVNCFRLPRRKYNCIINNAGYAAGKVKVFHGRLLDIDTDENDKTVGRGQEVKMDDAVAKINSQTDQRVFWRKGSKIKIAKNKRPILKTLEHGLSKYGLFGSISIGLKRLLS